MPLSFSSFFSLKDWEYTELFDLENPWDIFHKLKDFFQSIHLGEISGEVSPQAILENWSLISIGKGTIIEGGAYIKGPCLIGENCIIRQGAYIRDHTIIGNDCTIGHCSEIKSSIFLPQARAAHFNYVGNSVIGSRVNLGAGVRCANVRLDNGSISFVFEGKTFNTGLNKLGSIIGDDVKIGCNTVLSPGTFIGKSSFCYPCLHLSGVVSSHSIVKEKSMLIIKKRKKD